MMHEDYLWDRSGEPDPETVRLEKLLGTLRHTEAQFRPAQAIPPRVARYRKFTRLYIPISAAAVLLAGIWITLDQTRTAWKLDSGQSLFAGQWVRTGEQAATLRSDEIGEVELLPDSELRVLEAHSSSERLHLRRGSLHAMIWAPPRRFVIDTPGARTIDLGCEYTLQCDEYGSGLVRVHMGWVAFEHKGRESFIPAGAACRTLARSGPGIPYFEDASEALIKSLQAFEEQGDRVSAEAVISAARQKDGLTLWHLLTRLPPDQRGSVYDRFAALIPLPDRITRAAVLAGDSKALDACWEALGFENADWWRTWERRW